MMLSAVFCVRVCKDRLATSKRHVLLCLSKELSYNILFLIYNTILLPYPTYCCITWGFTYETYINKIFTITFYDSITITFT